MGISKAQKAAATARLNAALALALSGMDWATIAERAGYSNAGAAWNAVDRALKEARAQQGELVEQLRQVTVLRYNRLQAAYWHDALKGDTKAAAVVLKCMQGRARAEGVEAPVKLEHAGQIVTYQVEGVDLEQLK